MRTSLLNLGLVAMISLSSLFLLGGCAALRGSMSEVEMEAVIANHIRPGDPAPVVRDRFVELARPPHPDRMALERANPQNTRTPPQASYFLLGIVEQEYVFPFGAKGAEIHFFFDTDQRLISYYVRPFGGTL